MNVIRYFFLIAIMLFQMEGLKAQVLSGKVVKIADGDTFTLLTSDLKEVKIRLLHIDAPEKGQAFGNSAKQFLAQLIFSKEVRVEYKSKDRNGRILGMIFLGKQNINLSMVEAGYAWHFKKYSSATTFAKAEVKARRNKKGLWIDKNPQAPWDWRAAKKVIK